MTLTLIEGTQLMLTTGVGLLIWKYLPAYFSKKAENLATKEDLHRLTEIAERIRSQFSQVNTVHKVQFEAEFQAYQALCSAAHDAVVAHIRWQSLSFQVTEATVTAFGEAQLAFTNALRRFEPFIPDKVLREFIALDELFVDAKQDHFLQRPKTDEAKSEDRKGIAQAQQRCVAAIRTRLSEVLVV